MGLVGAGVLTIDAAVPMVMGANIGTTVTSTMASLGRRRQGAHLRRAFAAATVHDYFNILAVLAVFPLELAFGVVSRSATWLESGRRRVARGARNRTLIAIYVFGMFFVLPIVILLIT